ncbi:MAG: cytidylate kinase-like family protein [Elusimicrobia bacterium]|nr:cytidylate kinase-like family protein [Elusimicrobiota bacterium]
MGKLGSYLEAEAAALKGRGEPGRPRRAFITISRQSGAGGRSLAEALLAEMEKDARPMFHGWHIFDNELCEAVASDPKLSVIAESLIDERFRGWVEDYLAQSLAGLSSQLAVFRKIFKTIRGLVAGGNVVIVGRAGACVTRDIPGGTHVRLAAPMELRLSALMRRYGLEKAEAERKMESLEASRSRLVKTYFARDINDPLLYHAVFNAGATPPAGLARVIIAMAAEQAVGRA